MKYSLYQFVFLFLSLILNSCQDEERKKPLEDLSQPAEVTVRYELSITHSDLYDLSISYNDGLVCYDFKTCSYQNTDKRKLLQNLEISTWSYEIKARRGAILYVGADVISKPGISATFPAEVHAKIFVENKLVKENKGLIHSGCEYIYGIKEQNNSFYIYGTE